MSHDGHARVIPERELRQACAELDRRLRAGENCTAESILAVNAELAQDADAALELIYTEFVIREQLGQAPDPNAWYSRFPQWEEPLRELFQVHNAVRGADTQSAGAGHTLKITPERRIGDYEIIEEIARGGMGIVYKARHTSLNRIVALKMILAGHLATPEEVQRFRTEAENAANLDHPNIVPLYEVGEHGGRHYYAMKLLEGGDLRRLFNDQKAGATGETQRRAAALIVKVAQAVHYAHQRGILHRDLKPANILVSYEQGHAEPHVTDFGLAKRLRPGDVASGTVHTLTGTIVGTPNYMAPEQAVPIREPLTVAADVYSLGAILYELITGRPPFAGSNVFDVLRQVVEQEPTRPISINLSVDRDLQTICLRCLQKEPNRRYASALALAQDLERWLHGEPIDARPAGKVERAWKWSRRRPMVAGLAAALGLVLVVSFMSLTFLWLRAEKLGQIARDNLLEATDNLTLTRDAVDELYTKATEDPSLQQPGMQPVQKLLLEPTLKYYKKLIDKRGSDANMQEELARNYSRVARIRELIGDKEEALAAARQALAIRERLVATNPGEVGHLQDLAESLSLLGDLSRATSGGPAEALRFFQQARAIREELIVRYPDVEQHYANLAHTLAKLGSLYRTTGDYPAALELLEEARARADRIADNDSAAATNQSRLAAIYLSLGALYQTTEKRTEALHAYDQALSIYERLAQTHPGESGYQHDAATTLQNIATLQMVAETTTSAIESLNKARAIQEKLVRENPAVNAYREGLARTSGYLGHAYLEAGDFEAALKACQRDVELRTRLVSDNPADLGLQSGLANASIHLGRMHKHRGMPAKAVPHYEEALATLTALVRSHPAVNYYQNLLFLCRYDLGSLYSENGNVAAALESFHEARAIKERLIEKHPKVLEHQYHMAMLQNGIANALRQGGDDTQAIQSLERACDIGENLVQADSSVIDYHISLAGSLDDLAMLQDKTGEHVAALASLERGQELLERQLERFPERVHAHHVLGNLLDTRGAVLEKLHRQDEAVAAYEQAIQHQRQVVEQSPQQHSFRKSLSHHYEQMARLLRTLGRPAEAAAASLSRRELWPTDPQQLYSVACELALCSSLVGGAKSELSQQERAERQKCADSALETVRMMLASGYDNVDRLKKDADLESLRARPEFRQLLAEAEAGKKLEPPKR
jgi:tetratricopeptide (TPR) repeat protein/tRNA A-37 threonylcarbamoyl transferase component Bud32